MRALALRFEGPLQSWGAAAIGPTRPTLDAPTTSGVLGLVGAALGVHRTEVHRLVALHDALALAVRVDRAGEVLVDYHTAEGVPNDEGDPAETQITRRRYLCDASFAAVLVAMGGGAELLDEIARALRRPRFVLSLGRRGCAPSLPVLASRDVLSADGWRSLLEQVPSTPRADAGTEAVAWVEGALARDERGAREVLLRDRLVGPLPRMFLDRGVKQVRVVRPAVDVGLAELLEGGAPRVGEVDRATPVTSDSVEAFFA